MQLFIFCSEDQCCQHCQHCWSLKIGIDYKIERGGGKWGEWRIIPLPSYLLISEMRGFDHTMLAVEHFCIMIKFLINDLSAMVSVFLPYSIYFAVYLRFFSINQRPLWLRIKGVLLQMTSEKSGSQLNKQFQEAAWYAGEPTNLHKEDCR